MYYNNGQYHNRADQSYDSGNHENLFQTKLLQNIMITKHHIVEAILITYEYTQQ